jgi:hypothetical protein
MYDFRASPRRQEHVGGIYFQVIQLVASSRMWCLRVFVLVLTQAALSPRPTRAPSVVTRPAHLAVPNVVLISVDQKL